MESVETILENHKKKMAEIDENRKRVRAEINAHYASLQRFIVGLFTFVMFLMALTVWGSSERDTITLVWIIFIFFIIACMYNTMVREK